MIVRRSRVVILIILMLFLTAGLMPEAFAAENDGEEVHEVSTWLELRELVNNSSEDPVRIRLTSDLTVTSGNAHNEGKTVEIDLNSFKIDGNGSQVFWNEKGEMTIKNGDIKNARSDFGGAINNRGKMTIENSTIEGCSAIQGGAILNYGTLTMNKTTIKNCRAARGGGIRIVPHDTDTSEIARSATAVLTSCWIENNIADGSNDTYGRGGGIGVTDGILTMTDCKVTYNKSTDDDGGGIDFDASGKTLTLINTEITGNKLSKANRDGGGINLERGSAVITDCEIRGNSAPQGGGIYISGAFSEALIAGTTKIMNNTATSNGGGGINNHAILTLWDDIEITGNTAVDNSHGIYHNGSALNMKGKIVVKDNNGSNVFLYGDKKINVTGALDTSSSIGVTTAKGRIITSGFTDNGNSKVEIFVPDTIGDMMLEDGEVKLTDNSTLTGGKLDKVTVSFHPVGQSSSLSIRDNGFGAGQNVVQLYNIGDSFRFWLTKADGDSYYIDFFGGANDYDPSNKRLDLSDNDGYDNPGNVVHVVKGNKDATNKRWRFIRNNDGTYYIQNVRSGLYWDLENDNFDDKNKLCQQSFDRAQKWEMEIVHADGEIPIEELKEYDSYSFKRKGKYVTGANWMSFLSDDTILSDVTIPGTHDAGTAHTDMFNAMAQCQQLSIQDQLYSGIRYFDLRFGPPIGYYAGSSYEDWLDYIASSLIVHGSFDTCLYKEYNLTLKRVMGWVTSFLANNPGETVILQVKEDRGGDDVREYAYEYFRNFAKKHPELVYIGDHVPKLSECRGKIVLLSRLKYPDSEFKTQGGQWAINVSAWPTRRDENSLYDPLGLAASGDNYEVWDQDEYQKVDDDKWKLICNSVFDAKTGAEAKRAEVREKNKDAWVVSYTSCVKIYPQNAARTLNPKLVNKLMTDRDVLKGQFLGVICSDFTDQQLGYLVYKQNFINDTGKITVRGITRDGEEPFDPLVYEAFRNETLDKVIGTEEVRDEIDSYFSKSDDYRPYGYDDRDNIEQLRRMPMTEIGSKEEYAENPVRLKELHGYDEPTLYVALDRVMNNGSDKVGRIDIEDPVCGTVVETENDWDWTLQTPKPELTVTEKDGLKFHVNEKDGVPEVYWRPKGETTLFSGTMEGGTEYTIRTRLETDWGYCLSRTSPYAILFGVYVNNKNVDHVDGIRYANHFLLQIKRKAVHVQVSVRSREETCTEPGWKWHYYCTGCGKRFDPSNRDHEMTDEQVMVPAGHDWIVDGNTDDYGWRVTKQATETEEGEETRICRRDTSHTETRSIPVIGHEHVLTEVKKKTATCEEGGNAGYWVCSGGDHPCGRYFSDQTGEDELDKRYAVWPALGHVWLDPEYIWSKDDSTVTAKCFCMRDHDHSVSETSEAEKEVLTEATCEEPGSAKLTAGFTNEMFTEQVKEVEIPALGHDWDDGEVTREVTCTEDGEKTFTCRHDPSHKKTEVIKAAGHHSEDTRVTSDTATCTAGGTRTIETYCTECGKVLSTSTETSDPLGHSWGAPTYTWSDDMTSLTGESVCENDDSHVKTETVAVHFETDPVPTCTEAGIKTWYSDAFEEDPFMIQEKTEELAPLGHDWGEWATTKAATETTNGEERRICGNDPTHVETRVIPAGNHVHNLTCVGEKAATCEEPGNVEYWICNRDENACHRYFSDSKGDNEIEKADTVTAALGHDWSDWTLSIPATCSSEGLEIRTCARDESHQETRKINMDQNAHDWGDWTVIKKATENEEGREKRICKLDDDHTEERDIPLLTVEAPAAKMGLAYIGAAQPLVSEGSADGGVIQYAAGSGNKTAPANGWSSTVPAGLDAGTYHVWYKVIGDEKHEDTEPKCVTVNIGRMYTMITAKDQTIKAGESISAGIENASANGLMPGDSLKEITLTAAGDSITAEKAAIEDESGRDVTNNYSIVYVPGKLTVVEEPDDPDDPDKPDEPDDPDGPDDPDDPVGPDDPDKTGAQGMICAEGAPAGSGAAVKWSRVKGASFYRLYGAYCGKKLKVLKTIKGSLKRKVSVKKLNGKKLDLDKSCKFQIRAYKVVNGKTKEIARSFGIHIIGRKNARYTNVKAVKVNRTTYTIRKGKTVRIKAKLTRVDKNKKLLTRGHGRKLRYMSSDKTVASVSRSGVIKARKAGKCSIYVVAINGKYKKLTVTVK